MDTPKLKDLMFRYLQFCTIIRNFSKYTIKSYQTTFKLFLRESGAEYPQDLTRDLLEKWFYNGRLERKWSASTFRDHYKHLNPFIKWLIREKHIEENHLESIEKPRIEHKLPRTLSKDEATLILDTSYHMRYHFKIERYRNRAIIGIMVLAGLRRQEVIKLKLNDVSLENRTIFISQAKWSKDRLVPVNCKLAQILEEYLKERDRMNKTCIHFFTGAQKDEPITESCIKKLINKIKQRTEIDFSAHILRHAFARLMLEGGCDIYTLSKIMGHSRITTTTIYLYCSNQQLSKSIEMHSLN
ncbi:tyrosine-type recombinase/integrase [Candidatus Peregrinibacteria bacterium]|nr:tyrosine-type recombinase/integrase [Candidatus Peregrinibacteria bacterium]